MTNRRETLKILGAIGATCAFPYASDELYGQHIHVARGQAEIGPPVFFSQEEFAVVSRITDLIIPATDTPGAVAARVPSYIDLVVSRNAEHQGTYRKGLAWLEETAGKPFLQLSEAEQTELLTPLCDAADADRATTIGELFFQSIKNMTADGYYTSQIGMSEELGFRGGAVLAKFPTCEVPEH